MDPFGNLPAWVVVLLALLLGGILMLQNVGWLLAARARLAAQRRKGPAPSGRPPRDARGDSVEAG